MDYSIEHPCTEGGMVFTGFEAAHLADIMQKSGGFHERQIEPYAVLI